MLINVMSSVLTNLRILKAQLLALRTLNVDATTTPAYTKFKMFVSLCRYVRRCCSPSHTHTPHTHPHPATRCRPPAAARPAVARCVTVRTAAFTPHIASR